ncbi:hypothetical protein [Chryseobacterium binzhouense]|uniref:hypothetical protein n=1 Tax=Chryseobacterium binzhouense TaxID=2593646 RepID=UPI00289AAEB3|nr:hypothetical protein [Chryseobacterium binzhouense]
MTHLFSLVSYFSENWKQQYGKILHAEHLNTIMKNMERYLLGEQLFSEPYFKDEIKENVNGIFESFVHILQNNKISDEERAFMTEKIPFQNWLMVLGQRLTSASIRNEDGIPPTSEILIESCQKPYNTEITQSQRAWEKHIGRTTDDFWGEIRGNNKDKQEKVINKITEILEHKTWWNIFYHYKHGLVYEIREKKGHGIRWNAEGTELIGFLEVFFK